MPSRQDVILAAAAVLGAGAWMFAALAAIGFLSGQAGSPLGWPVVFGLLAVAIAATRCNTILAAPNPQIVLTALGVIGAYIAVAFSDIAGAGGFAANWAWRFVARGYDLVQGIGIAVGIISAAGIWRHGVVLGASDMSERQLHRSFRIGIAALGFALLVEFGSGRDLGVGPMLLPFFAGSLSALAVARMRRDGASGASWEWLVGATVVGVVGLGLALAFVGSAVVREFATTALCVWTFILGGVLYGLRLLLEPIARLIAAALDWLLEFIPRAGGRPPLRIHDGRWWENLHLTAATPEEAIGQILQYPALLLIFATVCWIMLRAYRHGSLQRRRTAVEYREPIDADPETGLARLIAATLPSWLIPGGRVAVQRHDWEDVPGVADAFHLYYDALGLAAGRGAAFDPCLTASERLPDLARLLPGVPVERITACFVAACYGHKPIDRLEAEALRSAMLRATVATQSAP